MIEDIERFKRSSHYIDRWINFSAGVEGLALSLTDLTEVEVTGEKLEVSPCLTQEQVIFIFCTVIYPNVRKANLKYLQDNGLIDIVNKIIEVVDSKKYSDITSGNLSIYVHDLQEHELREDFLGSKKRKLQ